MFVCIILSGQLVGPRYNKVLPISSASSPDIPWLPRPTHRRYASLAARYERDQIAARKSRPRLPITPPILREMKGVWERDPSNFDHIMIWAACTLCFFGFLRSGEITVPSDNRYDPGAHVRFTDVAIDDCSIPNLMRIRCQRNE